MRTIERRVRALEKPLGTNPYGQLLDSLSDDELARLEPILIGIEAADCPDQAILNLSGSDTEFLTDIVERIEGDD